MSARQERLEQFKSDIAQLKLKAGKQRRDSLVQGLGLLLMLGGAVASLIIYEASLHQKDVRNIGSEQVLATAMLIIAVLGSALFLSASLAKFLRIWLLRQLYEGQAHVDEVVAAMRRTD